MHIYARAGVEILVGDKKTARDLLEQLVVESRDLPKYALREAKPWVKLAKKTLRDQI